MYLPDEDMDYDHRILLTPASSHQSSVTVMPSSVASSFKDYGTLRGRSSSRSSSSFSSTTSDGVLVLPPSHSPEPPTPLVVKRAPLPEVVDVVDSSSNAVPGEGGHPSSLQAHSTGYSPCYLPAHSILDLHPPASNTGSSGQSVVGSVAFFSNGPAFPNYSPYMPPAALDSPGLFGPRSPRDSYPKLPSRTPIVLDIDRASPGLFGPRSPPGTYPELPSTVLEPEPAHADDNRPLSFAQVDLIGSPGRPWSWVGSRTPIVIDERRSCSPSPAQPPVRCQRPPSVVAPCLPASRSRSRSWSPGIPCPSEVYDRSRSRTYSSRSISPVSHRSVSRGRTRSRTPPPIVVTAPTDHVLPRPRCGVSISPPRGSVRLRREYTPHYSPSPPRCISPPYYRHSPRSPRRGSRSRSRSRSYVARSWPRSRSPSRIVGVPAQPVLVTDSRVSSKSSVHSMQPPIVVEPSASIRARNWYGPPVTILESIPRSQSRERRACRRRPLRSRSHGRERTYRSVASTPEATPAAVPVIVQPSGPQPALYHRYVGSLNHSRSRSRTRRSRTPVVITPAASPPRRITPRPPVIVDTYRVPVPCRSRSSCRRHRNATRSSSSSSSSRSRRSRDPRPANAPKPLAGVHPTSMQGSAQNPNTETLRKMLHGTGSSQPLIPPPLGLSWGLAPPPAPQGPSWCQAPPPPPQFPGWGQAPPPPAQGPSWGQPLPSPPLGPSWGQPPPLPPQGSSWGQPLPPPPQGPSWGQPPPPPPQGPSWGQSPPPPPQGPSWGQNLATPPAPWPSSGYWAARTPAPRRDPWLELTPRSVSWTSPRRSIRQKHPQYWHVDGNFKVLIGNVEYKLHSYLFKKAKDFSGRDAGSLGWTGDPPVRLRETQTDFDRFLSVLYPSDYAEHECKTTEEWSSVLLLADKWKMDSIRRLAISQLARCAEPVDKIALGQQYGVTEWLAPAYVALCMRPAPITAAEGQKMGVDALVRIAALKDEVCANLTEYLDQDKFCALFANQLAV